MLLGNQLLAELPDESIDQIATLAMRYSCSKQSLLFCQGDQGTSFFGIISGQIRLSSNSADGQEMHLIELGPGDTFGEIALIDGGPRTATAIATTDVVLFKIERAAFVHLLDEHSALTFQLLLRLCQRVRWTSELVEDLSFLDVPRQLAKRISLLATTLGKSVPEGIELNLSQHELATFLSLSRQAVNIHLQVWRQAGWIDPRRGKLLILDLQALDDYVANNS